jgi:hypothetical protein
MRPASIESTRRNVVNIETAFGIAVCCVVAATLLFRAAVRRDERRLAAELAEVFDRDDAAGPTSTTVLTENDVAHLPAPIRRWLRVAGAIGRPRPRAVRVRQHGTMRTSPDSERWLPFVAEQVVRVDPPTFVWRTRVRWTGGVPLIGRDAFVAGAGSMRIRLLGLLPVVHAHGPELATAALVRYLAELCWLPGAVVGPHVEFATIDDPIDPDGAANVRATLTVGDVVATGVFRFGADGHPRSFAAQRWYAGGANAGLRDWLVAFDAIGERDGQRVPVECRLTWRLPGADFEWFRVTIDAIERRP